MARIGTSLFAVAALCLFLSCLLGSLQYFLLSIYAGKNAVVDRLNAIGATLTPTITVVTQPAHSPDMNVNGLGLFRALDVKVQRRRRGTRSAGRWIRSS